MEKAKKKMKNEVHSKFPPWDHVEHKDWNILELSKN
jgi:hypothetical protein